MAEIFYFYVQDDRTITFHSPEPIMQGDKDVAVWKFRIPKALNQIDMSNWAWWFVYTNAKGQKFSKELMLGPDYDEPGVYNTAEISIGHEISMYPGDFSFALDKMRNLCDNIHICHLHLLDIFILIKSLLFSKHREDRTFSQIMRIVFSTYNF